MRTATELLTRYARYHRDERNIASHFIGVPLIVFALGVLLSRPAIALGGLTLSPAWIAVACTSVWYLSRGNLLLGAVVSAAVGGLTLLAHRLADGSIAGWLGWGLGTFVVGWLVQLAGHWYEGRRPAFVDDLVGILVGPMFVAAEAMFMLGWNKPLLAEIERRAGPTVLRDLAKIA